MGRPGAFLDRDGVLVRDVDLLVRGDQLHVLEGVPEALRRLAGAGYALVVVTNQPVVARGLCTEADVAEVHDELARRLSLEGVTLAGIYTCFHHPKATRPAYRLACECRKPRPGMILKAAAELGLDLSSSILFGDRPSDITAGERAGVRAFLVEGPMSVAPPIESPDGAMSATPHGVFGDLLSAVGHVLRSPR